MRAQPWKEPLPLTEKMRYTASDVVNALFSFSSLCFCKRQPGDRGSVEGCQHKTRSRALIMGLVMTQSFRFQTAMSLWKAA